MSKEVCGFAAGATSLLLCGLCVNPNKTSPSPLGGATSPFLRNRKGLQGTRFISSMRLPKGSSVKNRA